jgi:hypothetical protein
VYYQDWHRTRRPRPAAEGGLLPAVSRAMGAAAAPADGGAGGSAFSSPRNTLSSVSGVVVAVHDSRAASPPPPLLQTAATLAQPAASASSTALPFDEEAKLVFGVVYSLRNMIKKLSGRFVSSDPQSSCLLTRRRTATSSSRATRPRHTACTSSRRSRDTSSFCSVTPPVTVSASYYARSTSARSSSTSSRTHS